MTTDLAARVTEAMTTGDGTKLGATLADCWAEYRATVAALDAARAEVERLKDENEAYRIREELGLNTSDLLARATQAEAERDEARAAVQAACDVAVTEAVRAIERARDEAEADARRLRAAVEGVLFQFKPEHMDVVSGTDCGTRLAAALAGKEGP